MRRPASGQLGRRGRACWYLDDPARTARQRRPQPGPPAKPALEPVWKVVTDSRADRAECRLRRRGATRMFANLMRDAATHGSGSLLCQGRGFGAVECAPALIAVKTSDAVRGQAASAGVVVDGVGKATRSS